MLKKLIFASTLALLLPFSALAYSDVSTVQVNGVTVDSGHAVQVPSNTEATLKVGFQNTDESNVESIRVSVIQSDGAVLSSQCTDITDRVTTGSYSNTVLKTLPAAEGTYGLRVELFGDYGPSTDDGCWSGASATRNYANVVKVSNSAPVSPAPVPTTPPATSTGGSSTDSCVTLSSSLSMGMRSSDVASLQNSLISAGFSIPAGATGYFGEQTFAAVKAYQTSKGIPSTGFVGPLTRGALSQMCQG